VYPPDPDDFDATDAHADPHAHQPRHVEPGMSLVLRIAVGIGVSTFLIGALTLVAGFAGIGPRLSQNLPVSPASAASTPEDQAQAEMTGLSPMASPSAPPSSKAPAPKQPAVTATGNAGLEAQVFAIVNTERAKNGCRALSMDSRLTAAARKHSADMAARGYFDHTTPEGVKFATRISNEGYRWSGAGENIAKGQRTPADVMTSWMNSPGHRANILNCGFRDIGVGVAADSRGALVWTQDFASPA
jgi:uncharacterized protein YkwD